MIQKKYRSVAEGSQTKIKRSESKFKTAGRQMDLVETDSCVNNQMLLEPRRMALILELLRSDDIEPSTALLGTKNVCCGLFAKERGPPLVSVQSFQNSLVCSDIRFGSNLDCLVMMPDRC